MPYIYSSAWGVTNRGETLMRVLPLEFSSDPGTRGVSDEFMFGPNLLVNPVTVSGATQRSVYLPAGSDWLDFWSGKRVSGGQTITADAPLDRMPMYGKAGSIIAIGPRVSSTAAKDDPIELRVYSGENANFSLYDDQGDNYDYEHGAFARIPMRWNEQAHTLTIGARQGSFPGMLEKRRFEIVFVSRSKPAGFSFEPKTDRSID